MSPPTADSSAEIALAYLTSQASQLNLTAADLESPYVTDQYTDADTGLAHVYFQQQVDGLAVAYSDFAVTVSPRGQVLSIGGGFVPGLSNWLAANSAAQTRNIDAVDAVRAAAAQLNLALQSDPVVESQAEGPSQFQWIVAPELSLDPIPVRLQYVPTADGGAALAWQLVVRTPNGENWFDLSVPATRFGLSTYGDLLSINDWVEHATYNVIPLPNESPQDGGFALQTNIEDAVASPFGWHDTNGASGAEFNDTRGNNVDAHLDRDGNNVADTSPVRPSGGTALDFSGITFDPAGAPSTLQNENFAQLNLFWMNNLLHDIHYKYGFTEVAGNFQVNNYSRGGAANDAVQADAQDNAIGGSANNANFATPPDGAAPRMQMYEFTSTTPRRDSDLDNNIIIHEYGHGVSNRLTGGPANSNALTATQSSGMGEGWSDWDALMFLQRPTDTQNGGYGLGTYVLGQAQSGVGIRRQRYSFDMTVDPITFNAFGSGTGKSTEVHNTGEIWASTLWDMNWLLINKYGYDTDLYTGYSGSGPGGAGNKLALRLVMDAMKLQPANPSFTQARDAILAADGALTSGANSCEIWTAFARRGLGQSASTASSSSTTITTNFTVPAGACGLAVASTVPAVGSVVASVPVDYVVNFSGPVLASSLEGIDLAVDAVAASSVVLNTSTQAAFHFTSPPSATEGLHTISLGQGSILRASDNSPLSAFSGQFRVDSLPLTVVSTVPPAGTGVFTLSGPLTLDVNFNEPVDPASVQTSDLVLSGLAGATVSAVSLVNGNSTARFTISGISSEGTLSASIAAAAVTDVFGNAGTSTFSGSYAVDVAAVGLATPLASRLPVGSLIYGGSASGAIAPATDTDSFTLSLDAAQTLSVVVTPTGAALRPSLTLLDPVGVVMGLATAPATGGPVLLQTVPINEAGIYTVIVSAAGGTTGPYTVQATLNAALESESNGGDTNNSLAAAQKLDVTSIAMGGEASRLGVIGSIGSGSAGSIVDFESGILPASISTYSSNASGRIRVTAPGGSGNASAFALLMDSNSSGTYALNEAVYTVNLSGLTQANLSFSHDRFSDETETLPSEFTGHFNGDGVSISDDGNRWRTILNAPTNSTWTTTTIDLAAAAMAAGMTIGPNFRIKFQQYDNFAIPTDGRGYDNIQIAVPDAQDIYQFTLSAGDTASLALKGLTAGTLNAEIVNSGGVVLAMAVAGPTNFDKALVNFAAQAADTYYLVIRGSAANIAYSAVVTRNAAFNAEPNNTTAQATNLVSRQSAGEQWTLGHVGGAGDGIDLYLVNLEAGATLAAQSFLPAAGPSEFVNTLDPRLRILNTSGGAVATDENSADGRNAAVSYTNPGVAGVFYVEVAPTTLVPGTSGEYVLKVTGNTVTPTPFQVLTSIPASGIVVIAPPTTYTVDFNLPFLSTSVDAADVRLDGVSATGVTLVDGDTARFNLPGGINQGVHTVTIAAGAISDASGTPLTAYSGTFNLDLTAPRVTAVSPAPNVVINPGSLSYVVTFSEPMKVSNLSSDDFNLLGVLLGVTYSASSFSFNPAGTTLTLNYSGLPEDNYSLTLVSGASGGANFTDLDGNALDGEFSGTFPSGNGTAGGNFGAMFSMDVLTEAFPTPLVARLPLGSRIYDGSISRVIASAVDDDEFTLSLDAGQTITVLVTPTSVGLQPRVTLVDSAGATLGSASAAAAGQNALLQTVAVSAAGIYAVRVGGSSGTIGLYTLQVVLNAAWESESQLSGQTNHTLATAQDISASFTTEQTSLAAAARGAVLGITEGGGAYMAAAVTPAFQDISTTGTRSTFVVGDSSADTLMVTQLAGFTFPLYGVSYSSVSFSTNGLITFGGTSTASINTDLSTLPSLAAIAVLWDDLFVEDTGTGTASRAIFWQVVGAGANRQLIVQWNNVRQLGGSTYFTVQAVLSLDGTIQFNYANSVPSTVVSSATVGIKATGTSNPQRLLLSFNQPSGALVGPDLSTRINLTVATPDYYAFPLAAGEMATLVASGGDVNLELRDATDAILATGLAGATNIAKLVSNFIAPTAGTYYARVSASTSVSYSLVAMRGATFDIEANDTFAAAQSLGGAQAVLGSVASGTSTLYGATRSGQLFTANVATGAGTLVGTLPLNSTEIEFDNISRRAFAQAPDGSFYGQEFNITNAAGIGSIINNGASFTGMEWVGSTLYATAVTGPSGSSTLRTLNPFAGTSTIIGATGFGPISGLAYDTTSSVMYGITGGTAGTLLTLNLSTGAATSVGAAGFRAGSLEFGPDGLLYGGGTGTDEAKIFRINKATGAGTLVGLTGIGAAGTMDVTGLALVEVSGGEDWYALDLTSGVGRVRLETSTPAAGPGQFANTLNPHLQLYSSANVLIASGVALGDGRNESLLASSLAADIYKVRVTGEGNTQGEYLLNSSFNASPIIHSVAATSPITEGQSTTLSGSFTDSEAQDTHAIVINWGPGQGSTTLNLAAGVFTFSAAHQYLDDGAMSSYSVNVTVTDDSGASALASTIVVVNNLPPAIMDFSSASSIDENDTLLVTGTFHDPGLVDTHTVVISWDDGQADTTLTTAGPLPEGASFDSLGNGDWCFTVSHRYLDDDPTGTPTDVYLIEVRITDDDGAATTGGASVTVSNVSPTVTGVTTMPIDEDGTTFLEGTINDVGTLDRFTVFIDWGNGVESFSNLPAGNFLFARQYLDNGLADNIPISITVTDDDGGSTAADVSVLVSNVAPAITSLTPNTIIQENDVFQLTGTFHDLGTLDTHTIVIDWGGAEGTTTLTTVGPNPEGTMFESLGNGDWQFSANHTYLDDNPTGTPSDIYSVRLDIKDNDGANVTGEISVNVNNVPPTPAITSVTSPRLEGTPITVDGDATDPGGGNDPLIFGWQVFKVGASVAFASANGTSFSFTPDNDGAYRIELTANDDDGGTATHTLLIMVDNVAPVASDLSASTKEDSLVAIVQNATDVLADVLDYTIVTPPQHGTLSGVMPNLTYHPAADYNGPDSFTYQAGDGQALSNLATVALSISPVNDRPSFERIQGDYFAIDEDPATYGPAFQQIVSGWANNVSAGPANESGQALSFVVTNDNRSLFAVQPTVAFDGTLTYTPAPNVAGTAHLTVTLRDDGGTGNGGSDASDAETLTINVTKAHVWHNTLNGLDVTGPFDLPDGQVVAADALEVINHINAFGSTPVPTDGRATGPYYDVNADGSVAPSDALDVINHINAFGSETEGESLAGPAGASPAIAGVQLLSNSAQSALNELIDLLVIDVAAQPKRRIS